jgi:hypothetical protein
MKKAFYILVPLILWSSQLFAQLKFKAVASKYSVCVGERFEVKFSTNANGGQFSQPDWGAFQMLYGPNSSVSQIVNNSDTTFNLTYSCIIVAKKEGTFNIDSASIMVGAQQVFFNSLQIKVKGQFAVGQQQKFKVPDTYISENSSKSAPVDIKTLANYYQLKYELKSTPVIIHAVARRSN